MQLFTQNDWNWNMKLKELFWKIKSCKKSTPCPFRSGTLKTFWFLLITGPLRKLPSHLGGMICTFFVKKNFMRFIVNHLRTNFPIICILESWDQEKFCGILQGLIRDFMDVSGEFGKLSANCILLKISATLRLEVFICNLEVKLWSNTKTTNMSLTQWTLQMFLWFWNDNFCSITTWMDGIVFHSEFTWNQLLSIKNCHF